MAIKQELKKTNPLYKEFQALLDKEFSNKNLKENQIIKATVTEINNKFIICDAGGKSESHISVDEFKQNDELSKLKKGSITISGKQLITQCEIYFAHIIISRDSYLCKIRSREPSS